MRMRYMVDRGGDGWFVRGKDPGRGGGLYIRKPHGRYREDEKRKSCEDFSWQLFFECGILILFILSLSCPR